MCEQLSLGCYLKAEQPGLEPAPCLSRESNALTFHHRATLVVMCVCVWYVCRTCAFQVLYMLLVLLFHGIAVHDGLHVVLMAEPHGNHLRFMFVLLFTNLLLYIICCHSDPGELAAEGAVARLMQHSLVAHPYDGTLYHPGVICSTCHIVKPARSKHCSKFCRVAASCRRHSKVGVRLY